MDESRPSNRPTPRTPAAIEAELRRRVRMELTQARADGDGQLDDASLAEIIARAIASALGWHVESPEHVRNATLSSRTWRPAGGPRAGYGGPPPPPRDFDEPRRPPPRDFDEPRRPPYPPRGPRPDYDEPYREDEEFRPPPRRGPGGAGGRPSGPRSGGRSTGPRSGSRRPPPSRGGGFGPRKPRRKS